MLKINSKALVEDLTLAIMAECDTLTDWLWTQVSSKAPPQVRRDMIGKEVTVIAGKVVGRVWAGGMGALTTEWGSGSLADTSNPAWDDYVNSKYWNPARDPARHTIRGRPAGEYVDLEGETKVSSGRWEGRNLEWKYPPEQPQHWLRELVALSEPYVIKRIIEVVTTFPMHQFIHDGR